MKILVRVVDDWMEIYINGIFIMDNLAEYFDNFLREFLLRLNDIFDNVEVKIYTLNYLEKITGLRNMSANAWDDYLEENLVSYEPPLKTITGCLYWSDWEIAIPILEYKETN